MAKTRPHTGVLLVNVGTPDSPETPAVRRYLREFLMDGRVLDIDFWKRWLLVNLIIAPIRGPKSAKLYKELWTSEGSPLVVYGQRSASLLQEKLGDGYVVRLGMRYQNPSLQWVLDEWKSMGLKNIILLPLFPQYASASTGTAIQRFQELVGPWEIIPNIRIISNFPDHPLLIQAFVDQAKKHLYANNYDHYIFTYHGLPERQILKGSCQGYCQLSDKCCSNYNDLNQFCYRAQCYQTTRVLAKELGIDQDKYTVCFQSRLGKTPWIKPYTDDIIKQLTDKGVKRVLAMTPSFVSDCLETTIEVGEEYKELFEENGGESWTFVESLNDSLMWINCMESLVLGK